MPSGAVLELFLEYAVGMVLWAFNRPTYIKIQPILNTTAPPHLSIHNLWSIYINYNHHGHLSLSFLFLCPKLDTLIGPPNFTSFCQLNLWAPNHPLPIFDLDPITCLLLYQIFNRRIKWYDSMIRLSHLKIFLFNTQCLGGPPWKRLI